MYIEVSVALHILDIYVVVMENIFHGEVPVRRNMVFVGANLPCIYCSTWRYTFWIYSFVVLKTHFFNGVVLVRSDMFFMRCHFTMYVQFNMSLQFLYLSK